MSKIGCRCRKMEGKVKNVFCIYPWIWIAPLQHTLFWTDIWPYGLCPSNFLIYFAEFSCHIFCLCVCVGVWVFEALESRMALRGARYPVWGSVDCFLLPSLLCPPCPPCPPLVCLCQRAEPSLRPLQSSRCSVAKIKCVTDFLGCCRGAFFKYSQTFFSLSFKSIILLKVLLRWYHEVFCHSLNNAACTSV